MKVVVIAEPFHWIAELAVKPVPFTVSVSAALLATAATGVMLVTTGGCAVTGSKTVFVVTATLKTTIETLPAPVIALAGTDAVSCVALTNFVVSGELFHTTVAPEVKPVPLTVRVKAAL